MINLKNVLKISKYELDCRVHFGVPFDFYADKLTKEMACKLSEFVECSSDGSTYSINIHVIRHQELLDKLIEKQGSQLLDEIEVLKREKQDLIMENRALRSVLGGVR